VDAQMTAANKITEIPLPVASRTGSFTVVFRGDSLNALNFAVADSEVLQVGLKIRSDTPTGARVASPAFGTLAPTFNSYVTAIGVADSLKSQTIGRTANEYFTASPPGAPI